ncbi:MAG: isoprenylcysteine carboxylmethyltransferase family protein [Chloroflexi bacterium]|nr:isoprenylcysteine carboxylmethyltransferase family protein [Chloroflexota bacterium]
MLPLIATNRIDLVILNISYAVWVIPETYLSFRRRSAPGAQTSDRRSGFVLWIGIWLGIFAGYIFAFAEKQFAIPWHRTLFFWLGIVLMLMGVIFRQYSIRVLGKYFTTRVAIQPGQTVVESGPYRWIRHPSYSGALITIFGLALSFANWLSLIFVLLIPFLGYSYRVRVEENTLVNALGQPYKDYMKRTKRFIPFVY